MRCATGYSGRVNKTCTWKEDTILCGAASQTNVLPHKKLTETHYPRDTEENITLGRVNISF